MHSTHNSKSCPEKIIPFRVFNGNFLDILFKIPDILTRTEKKLLQVLNGFAFKDGHCFPRRSTIALKLGVTVKTISRVVKSLVGKGFLAVEAPDLNDRHLYGKTNRYYFLPHPIYETVMSPEMSPEKTDSSFNIKINSPKKPAARSIVPVEDPKERTARYQTELDILCDKIARRVNPAGSRFNPLAFRFKHLKLYGPDAVKEALEAILEKLESIRDTSIIKAFEWWGLGMSLLKTHKAMNEPTCTGWLGDDFRPPDRLPGRKKEAGPVSVGAIFDRMHGIAW